MTTTKAAHTPGPWGVCPETNGTEMVAYDAGPWRIRRGICRFDHSDYSGAWEEYLANARLIAAAPEQNAALVPFAEYGKILQGQRVRPDAVVVEIFETKITVQDFLNAAAAIAKATGAA